MAQEKTGNDWQCGADLVVKNLEAQGVKHVFGIPGAARRRKSCPGGPRREKLADVLHSGRHSFLHYMQKRFL